ncbi:dynein axonemal light chain 4 isoform 1-T1 [Hipposideros larvatus]
MGEAEGKKDEADYKRLQTFPLVRHSDMPEEMRVETMELCVTACEKFSNNNESAAKMIKETMDKKFGSSWHVVIGEGFGFEITHESLPHRAAMRTELQVLRTWPTADTQDLAHGRHPGPGPRQTPRTWPSADTQDLLTPSANHCPPPPRPTPTSTLCHPVFQGVGYSKATSWTPNPLR